jgi:hypothetical protein
MGFGGAVSQDPTSFPYELYDLGKDWTQDDDIAAKYPDKVKEMDKLFWDEAAKYQVLPPYWLGAACQKLRRIRGAYDVHRGSYFASR